MPTTREQDTTVEQLAMRHGRVHCKGGYTDGLLRATTPNGAEFYVNADGAIVRQMHNFSVQWEDRSNG